MKLNFDIFFCLTRIFTLTLTKIKFTPIKKVGAALLFISAISSCVSTSKLTSLKPESLSPNSHVALSEIDYWKLNARIAITTPDESITASLNWLNKTPLFDFHLTGAFGVTYAHLIQGKKRATLEIPDTEMLTHDSAQELLQRALGWEFPIESLAFWVKGLPSGNPNEEIIYNTDGTISKIYSKAWRIEFNKYKKYQGYTMPKRIRAIHPNLTLKLSTREWRLYE